MVNPSHPHHPFESLLQLLSFNPDRDAEGGGGKGGAAPLQSVEMDGQQHVNKRCGNLQS